MIISDLQYLENASDSQLVEGSAAFAFASASALAFGRFFASGSAFTFTVTDYIGEFFAQAGSSSESVSF
jgi:hypothetical protein